MYVFHVLIKYFDFVFAGGIWELEIHFIQVTLFSWVPLRTMLNISRS